MKTIYKLMCALMVVLCGTACSDNTSDLNLDGDCSVEAFEINSAYKATIDPVKRIVKVKVPVDFTDKTQLKVSQLVLSEGATSNIKKDDVVDFTGAKTLHVTNGDLYLDWTVKVQNDEAKITSFIINDSYKASINEAEHTITAFVPASVDVTKIIPTIEVGEDAVVYPASGVQTDFTDPVVYTVTDNTASQTYTVTVEQVSAPEVIFLGSAEAATMDDLVPEEKEACKWMLANIPNSLFVSWEDLKNNNVDLSKCKLMWWHWQHQPSENLGDFESGATSTAMSVINTLNDFYHNGGAFILSRASINFAAELGAVKDQLCANNCWGSNDDGNANGGGIWDFPAMDESSWIWAGIKGGFPVKLNDEGYVISNCVSQWGSWFHDGDFGKFEEKTGCKVLAHGWDNAVTMWECPAADGSFGKGGIVCFGSGCYDWYSPAPFESNLHDNMGIITQNAINHLTK